MPSGSTATAAGINPGEAAIRSGALAERFPTTFPSGQGGDFAGVVAGTGAEVLGWTWGRASHAEYVVAPETQVAPRPAALGREAAGSLAPCATTGSTPPCAGRPNDLNGEPALVVTALRAGHA
ncbi:hypothetical protein AQI95_24200 [Streptomyces yokosukanensis]|uniref:Uncharacterized protein n=1 Tax=Streptomyces yokosukanensis TaxID=67386 RepID=A0A117Q1N6_9ACTN|nr:hypothetical protein AQI95_24200 [Streptomyces yokosukanensis]